MVRQATSMPPICGHQGKDERDQTCERSKRHGETVHDECRLGNAGKSPFVLTWTNFV